MRRLAVLALATAPAVLAAPGELSAQTVYPTGTTIWQQGKTWDGYTLFREIGGSVVLIDMDGTVVHTWTSPTPGGVLFNAVPLAGGRILVYDADGSSRVRRRAGELAYDGGLLWGYAFAPNTPLTTAFHHDIERLPGGSTLVLAHEEVTVPAISALPVRDDFLMEIDANGRVVDRWKTSWFFDDLGLPADQKAQIAAAGGDWGHLNSISVIPANAHTLPALAEGNVIVSYRHINTIAILDRASGRVVWRMGPGPDHKTHGQHTVHMIEQGMIGAGNLLVFDNGCGTGWAHGHPAPGRSRVIEIDPVSRAIVWEYSYGKRFYSDTLSGAQRLPNGNTLICSGVKGRLFEVRPNGEIVWEFLSPFFQQQGLVDVSEVYRAYRLPYDWVPAEHR